MKSDQEARRDGSGTRQAAILDVARYVGATHEWDREDDLAMRRALLDTFAVSFAAGSDPAVAAALGYVSNKREGEAATLWVTGSRGGEESAAFFNAIAGHALDYDDVSVPVRGHLSVVLFPALLALAEAESKTWGEVFRAYVVGTRLGCALGKAYALPMSLRGWHTTSVIGMFAATAACARLLRLTEDETANALGISAAGLAGNLESFGTWSKPMQAGQAACGAVRSARLAQRGFTGPVTALDGARGFVRLYVASEDTETFRAAWEDGKSEAFRVRETLEIKKYPACYAAHRALDALHDLRDHHGFGAQDVARIAVRASPRSLTPLVHSRPETGPQAKFSLQYCLACMLVDGGLRMASFTDEAVRRPVVRAWLDRIDVRESAEPQAERWTEVSVLLTDGSRVSARATHVRGGHEHPMTAAELMGKVHDCLDFGGNRVDGAVLGRLLDVKDESRVRDDMADMVPTLPLPR